MNTVLTTLKNAFTSKEGLLIAVPIVLVSVTAGVLTSRLRGRTEVVPVLMEETTVSDLIDSITE